MNPQDYVIELKTKYGDQTTKDGMLIRDMNDQELLKRTLERYPGERSKLVGLDEYFGENEPKLPPKSDVEIQMDEMQDRAGISGFFTGIGAAGKERWRGMKEALGKSIDGEQTLGSGFLQAAGEGAGFIGDAGFEAIKAAVPNSIEEKVGGVVESIAETQPVQDVAASYVEWKEKNPEIAENLEAAVNIASIIPGVGAAVKTGQKVVQGVSKAVPKVIEAAGTATGVATAGAKSLVAPNLAKEAVDISIIGPQGKKATIAGLERSGTPGGYAPDESFFGKLAGADKYVPSKRDLEIAESVKGVVRKKNTPAKNITNINDKITEIAETVVRPVLAKNPQPFNVATYSKRLKDIEMPDFIKTDEALQRTYEAVRNRFIEVAKRHPKTKEGLWDARKEIDSVIEQQFGAAGFNPDKYSALQKAILDMRRATNEFIAEDIPDDVFKKEMRNMSNMYSARHNIALENYAIQNKDGFVKWTTNNPKKWAALKLAGWGTAIAGGTTFLAGD